MPRRLVLLGLLLLGVAFSSGISVLGCAPPPHQPTIQELQAPVPKPALATVADSLIYYHSPNGPMLGFRTSDPWIFERNPHLRFWLERSLKQPLSPADVKTLEQQPQAQEKSQK